MNCKKIQFVFFFLFVWCTQFFIVCGCFAAGWVDLNGGLTVSPSPVTVGKDFAVSFSLKEYNSQSKSFEYIQLWIQDGSGNDLYDAAIWNNVSFSALQQKNFSATTFLDPAYGRKPGSYRAIVRGKVVGDMPFNFGIISGSGAVNPRNFSAVPIIAQGPMSGVPGTVFTQWGTGFTPNSTATLHFKKPDGTEYPTQQQAMDSTGHFETQYTAPLDKAPGQYTWWAVDGPTGVSSNQVTYTIEQPPVNPAVAQTPMFGKPGTIFKQWGTGFTPNSTATLRFKKPDGTEYEPKTIQIDGEGHFVTSYTVPADKPAGLYTWWAIDGYSQNSSNQVAYSIFSDSQNVADIEVDIVENKAVYSIGDTLIYSIYVKNQGEDAAPDVTIDISCTEGFAIEMSSCSEINDSTCHNVQVGDYSAKFKANILAGQYVRIGVYGKARTGYDLIKLTAEAHDAAIDDPDQENNRAISVITTDVPNFYGSYKAELRPLPGSSNSATVDTVVLTHGLQKLPCNSEELWTSSKSDPAKAGYLIQEDLKAKGKYANIYQFFWQGACQEHYNGVPLDASYQGAWLNVNAAAQYLAKQLLDKLGPNYDKKIHFIGHSLGTAVNAYASKIFLNKATNVSKAQVTILDHPNYIGKIAGFIWNDDESEKQWGFDENFFANTLPFDRAGLNLYVDNYYAAFSGNNKLLSAGVGSKLKGTKIFNHDALISPFQVGDTLLSDESALFWIDNDHSGVNQWYRWTMRPNEQENFEGETVCPDPDKKWNNKPKRLGVVPLINYTLNPCPEKRGGWPESILLHDTIDFPQANGGEKDKKSDTAASSSGYSLFGCTAPIGSLISVNCTEEASGVIYSSKTSASQISSLKEEPQIKKSYIEFTVTVPKFLRYISFDYSFPNIGDGDYVYIFLDGVPVWKMSGEALTAGEIVSSGLIPVRAAEGQKKLIIVLYGVGQQNAQFSLNNFKFTTAIDTDSDDVADDEDAFPNNADEWLDTDKDGIGNNADTDDDNDGFIDTDDAFPLNPKENADTDGDGIGDYADLDDNMYPDLAVISRALNKTGLAPGEDFICWAAVKNKGTARTTTAPVRYYISTDSTISRSDTLLRQQHSTCP